MQYYIDSRVVVVMEDGSITLFNCSLTVEGLGRLKPFCVRTHITHLDVSGNSLPTEGGELVAEGTPEDVSRNLKSHTGASLREVLN